MTASGWLQACPLGGRSRQAGLCQAVWLPGSASDVGRDDIRGVPVQAPAGPVVADRGPRVSVGGSLLNVAQRHTGVRAAVMNACLSVCGPTGLVILARRATLRTIRPSTVPVQPAPVYGEEDRPVAAFAGG